MDIGLGIPQVGPFADPDMARTVAVAAEATGYSSVWALDRLVAPVASSTPRDGATLYPHGSFPHGPSPRQDETSHSSGDWLFFRRPRPVETIEL